MKYDFQTKLISNGIALEMVKKYHYSNSLPAINKYFLGFYLDDELVGVMTLGYGTRPKNTIKVLFPSLDTKDYLEIGRMCMDEDMPRNSESQMIKSCIKWIKENDPNIKVLFTWADGVKGKCGYVYQASNFYYVGNIKTDLYIIDGIKVHPRQYIQMFGKRPSIEEMKSKKIEHVYGMQFKYFRFVCNKKEKKNLLKEMNQQILEYPKQKDLYWDIQIAAKKYKRINEMPVYNSDFNLKSENMRNHLYSILGKEKVSEQIKLF